MTATITLGEYRRSRGLIPTRRIRDDEARARHCHWCGDWTFTTFCQPCLLARKRLPIGICGWCGERFVPHSPLQRFCSMQCSEASRGKPMKGIERVKPAGMHLLQLGDCA